MLRYLARRTLHLLSLLSPFPFVYAAIITTLHRHYPPSGAALFYFVRNYKIYLQEHIPEPQLWEEMRSFGFAGEDIC